MHEFMGLNLAESTVIHACGSYTYSARKEEGASLDVSRAECIYLHARTLPYSRRAPQPFPISCNDTLIKNFFLSLCMTSTKSYKIILPY